MTVPVTVLAGGGRNTASAETKSKHPLNICLTSPFDMTNFCTADAK